MPGAMGTPGSNGQSAGMPATSDGQPATGQSSDASTAGATDGTAGTGGMVVDGSDMGAASAASMEDGSAQTPDEGADDGTGMDDGSPDARRPPCLQNARQLIVMGDSYVNWVSHTLPQDLASAYGGDAVGVWDVPYTTGGRLYAIGAWAMGSGGIGLIPDQLDFALADDPDIKAAVMTGGGNDFLVPAPEYLGAAECKNMSTLPPAAVCQEIVQKAFDAAEGLMQASADAGVEDVVYFFYPNIPAPTLLGGTSPNTLLDWTYPQVEALCDETEAKTGGKLRCHFLDTRPLFEGHLDWFAPGDIHPTAAGSKVIADAIVELMADRCIAQPESSGCCEP